MSISASTPSRLRNRSSSTGRKTTCWTVSHGKALNGHGKVHWQHSKRSEKFSVSEVKKHLCLLLLSGGMIPPLFYGLHINNNNNCHAIYLYKCYCRHLNKQTTLTKMRISSDCVCNAHQTKNASRKGSVFCFYDYRYYSTTWIKTRRS